MHFYVPIAGKSMIHTMTLCKSCGVEQMMNFMKGRENEQPVIAGNASAFLMIQHLSPPVAKVLSEHIYVT
jgi:hypothetical protein